MIKPNAIASEEKTPIMVSLEAVDLCLINVMMPAKTIENRIIAASGLHKAQQCS